jgi:hypothetical protein
MILHEPAVARVDGRIRVHARIATGHPRLASLDRLWFEVDASDGLEISDRADPFLVAMLPIAMACGERIEVRGKTSPRLAWGTRELQHVHFAWWPRQVKIVDVRCDRLEEAPPEQRGSLVACGFSGGVDSLYTVWSHTQDRESIPGFRISHALLINGFDLDIDLEDTGRFDVLRAIYAPLLAPLGVELITVRTNLRALRLAGVGQSGGIRSFGTALIAPALALSRSFGRLYLAAARGYGQFEADGSNPSTDHLLGTAGFQTIHDGAGVATRFAKVAVIADWPEALARLRVCSNPSWQSVDGKRGVIDNCGSCNKCVWTLTSLELLTGRTTFPSFPRPATRADLRRAARKNERRSAEILREAIARGRSDLAREIRWARAQRPLERLFPFGHRRQLRARAVEKALATR